MPFFTVSFSVFSFEKAVPLLPNQRTVLRPSCLPRFLHFPHPPLPLQVLPSLLLHLSLGSRKKSILKKQMVVTDDGEDVFYKLPGAKKRQAKNKHNLMDAVTNVRGAEKQH